MYKRYTLAVIVGAVALLLGLRTGSSVNALQSQARNEDAEKLLTTQSLAQWKYEATQIGPQIYIRISSPISGKSALKSLLTKHKGQHTQLFQSRSLKEIPVSIIMEKPIHTEDFTGFIMNNGINVQSYTMIAQDNTGELITFFGAPVNGVLFPEHILQKMVVNIEQAQNKKVSVQGVVSIDAKINIYTLAKLNNDPNILGIDITPALAVQDLIHQLPGIDPASVHITSAPFYWETVRQH